MVNITSTNSTFFSFGQNAKRKRSLTFRLKCSNFVILVALVFFCYWYSVTYYFALKLVFSNKDTTRKNIFSQTVGATQSDFVIPSYSNSSSLQAEPNNFPVIPFVITITSCHNDGTLGNLLDGAAVLKHSIHLRSSRVGSSSYDYKMYAIVHESARKCSQSLHSLGYSVLIRETPVPVSDIQGEFLRTHIEKNGCCGEKEFIKLYTYTLTDYPLAVLLDIDTIVLQPFDELFDYMLKPSSHGLDDNHTTEKNQLKVMWEDLELPSQNNAFFTKDYNMANPNKIQVGVQGGFLVVRTSQEVFEEFKSIIQKGDYQQQKGWGGKGYGNFYGSLTFQGIVPYYYEELHPNSAIELDRCVWNAMVDNPRDKRTGADNIAVGRCRDGRTNCEDCRRKNYNEIRSAHFTLCQKPWDCLPHDRNRIQEWLCRDFTAEWYRVRLDMELQWERNNSSTGLMGLDQNIKKNEIVRDGSYQKDHFKGFCHHSGNNGYIPIKT